MDGIRVRCGWCKEDFAVCRACWRNQRYCSKFCSKKSRGHFQRLYQAKYSKTEKGRASQKARQYRYRLKKIKTDQSTDKKSLVLERIKSKAHCRFCGREVGKASKKTSTYYSFRRKTC